MLKTRGRIGNLNRDIKKRNENTGKREAKEHTDDDKMKAFG